MPEHIHDCNACRYLGTAILQGRTWDYYHCKDIMEGTIIARYSSHGQEYTSGLVHIIRNNLHTMHRTMQPVWRYGLSLL